MAYSDKVVDHYKNPRNGGSMDASLKDVGPGIVGAPECGDVMKLQIQVDENDRIVDAKFKTFGCGSAIASSSLATEWVKGKTPHEATFLRLGVKGGGCSGFSYSLDLTESKSEMDEEFDCHGIKLLCDPKS